MVIAEDEGGLPVAAALYFESSLTLFGRYWGCLREYDNLHFEACYYQGIEYCIQRGLQRFDPGAQGEHKIQRGFEPTLTRSLHWVAEPGFREPIAAFCRREKDQVRAYQQEASALLPFKNVGDK
jgi:predicted N-acyltransferase